MHIAQVCEVLLRGFAAVGIVALVDEATGYQADRDRQELHKILEAYISKELLPWTKRFPDVFYKQMFRLWGWRYPPDAREGSPRGPRYVGKLTKQLIYEKLPRGVLNELERLNPPNEKWQRRSRHPQHLTEGIGNQHLEKQIAVVTALMRGASNKGQFKRLFARNFPEGHEQTEMFNEVERAE